MNSKEFIESGILELYVLGIATDAEQAEVSFRAINDPAIQEELLAIGKSLESVAMKQAVPPNPIIKPFLMATINYMDRIMQGEAVTEPPFLHPLSTIENYAPWLNRPDMIYAGNEPVFAYIIGHTKNVTTAIVWLKEMAPQEVHDTELESFLIVEGTCNIVVDGEVNALVPGDCFTIPLYKNHFVQVTSAIPCKVILQRVAA
jgi:mannose-6-phosphate isomerase-like protein (cupin superfamily)